MTPTPTSEVNIQNNRAHAVFLSNQVKRFHGKLESHLYTFLNPKSASLCATLIYTIPSSIIIKALPSTYTAALSLLGGAYLWSCREEIISNEAKIDILHSVAVAFFANMFHETTALSKASLLSVPLHTALLSTSLILANQLGKEEDVEVLENTKKDVSSPRLRDF